jgi:hypothetical protein
VSPPGHPPAAHRPQTAATASAPVPPCCAMSDAHVNAAWSWLNRARWMPTCGVLTPVLTCNVPPTKEGQVGLDHSYANAMLQKHATCARLGLCHTHKQQRADNNMDVISKGRDSPATATRDGCIGAKADQLIVCR